MADVSLNFRATAAYVTDPAGSTYCIKDTYPTTRNTWTFGFDSAYQLNSRDRSTSVDARLAGIQYVSQGNQRRLEIDGLSSGANLLELAAGDASYASQTVIKVYDSDGTLGTIGSGTLLATISAATAASIGAGEFIDATGVIRTSAGDWVTNNATKAITLSGTKAFIDLDGTATSGGGAYITHVKIAASGGGSSVTGVVTLTSTSSVSMTSARLRERSGSIASTSALSFVGSIASNIVTAAMTLASTSSLSATGARLRERSASVASASSLAFKGARARLASLGLTILSKLGFVPNLRQPFHESLVLSAGFSGDVALSGTIHTDIALSASMPETSITLSGGIS